MPIIRAGNVWIDTGRFNQKCRNNMFLLFGLFFFFLLRLLAVLIASTQQVT